MHVYHKQHPMFRNEKDVCEELFVCWWKYERFNGFPVNVRKKIVEVHIYKYISNK